MRLVNKSNLTQAALVLTSAFLLTTGTPAMAQDYPPPPSFSTGQLDSLVSRIALYPDPLLAQIFAAASFTDQIPEAARWADQYRNLRGNELADAIYQANLQFDPAVQALIPFPSVLDTMARDMNWTSSLGNAVLADRGEVMESVQRMRRSAEEYGYLRSNNQIRVVNSGAAVEIESADPALMYVPVYDPYVVYSRPRPGFFLGGAIGFDNCYSIGAFGGWGWGGGFNWYNHAVVVNNAVWGRTWYNRDAYVHNYGNWDRGEWRNSYNNRNVTFNSERNVYRTDNNNRYSNNTYSNSGYQRNNGQYNNGQANNTYSNAGNSYRGVQSAPVTLNPGYQRNAGQYNNGQANNSVQTAPVTPNPGYQRNAGQYNNGRANNTYSNAGDSYRGVQSAPVTPNTGYQPGYQRGNNQPVTTYANPGSSYRGVQSAPAAPSSSYQRNTYSNPGAGFRSAPAQVMQPTRSFGAVRGNDGGQSGHGLGGGRRP